MTRIRKLLFFVLATALTAFALPTFAASPSKIFGLTMDTMPSGNFIGGQVNTLSAKYTNLTPGGNSTINWVHLTVPNALWSTTPTAPVIHFPQGGSVYSITPGSTSTEIVVNNIPGIGVSGGTWYFTIDVYVPADPGCFDYMFSATAFTGNSGTQGQPFAYQSVYPSTGTPTFTSKPDIAVVSGCTLGFITQPASATVNTKITSVAYNTSGAAVQVGVYSAPAVLMTSFNGPVTLKITPNTGPSGAGLSGGSVNAVAGVATFAPSIDTAGTNYQLTASLAASGPSVDSNPFWITGASGLVDCTDGTNYTSSDGVTDPNKTYVDFLVSDPGNWGVRRGPNSLDGTNNNCKKVGVSLTIDGNSVATFLYDKSIPNQVGNFKYWIIWPETTVNPDATKETSYDSVHDASYSTARFAEKRPLVSWDVNQTYVPILNCASDDLNQGSALMPVIPDQTPFNAFDPSSPYYKGKTAQVCLAQHVMISSGISGGVFQVIYADKIVDQVDTLVRQP